jgi:hypothetical protein
MDSVGEWLMWLEAKGADEVDALYRWPRTPVGNLQAEIWRRCGASDWNMKHPNSRSGAILRTLQGMDENCLLPQPFTILDLCCGDGVILHLLARVFHRAQCFGADLLRYPTHQAAERAGVSFYRSPLQEIVASEPPQIVDVCMMLNTFRGWDRADLDSKTEHDLPQRTLAWMKKYCRYVFLTVNREQVEWLKREGWFVWDVGKGEDDSRLVCGFPCEGPEGPGDVWTLDKLRQS